MRVLACLAEGLGMRATARVFEVDPKTVLHWLVEAAEYLRVFSAYEVLSQPQCYWAKTHCWPQALHGWFCFPWLYKCGLSDDLSRTI